MEGRHYSTFLKRIKRLALQKNTR